MRFTILFFTLLTSLTASPRVINWMQFPFHPSSPSKQFYLELEFHNPSIWVSDWGSIASDGSIHITTTSDPDAIVTQVLYTAGRAYTAPIHTSIESISIFINGVALADFQTQNKVEFEYSNDLNSWQKMTVPVDSGAYFIRIKN